MRRLLTLLILVATTLPLAGLGLGVATRPALAYSYAAAGAEPLLDGREALFDAVAASDWAAARTARDAMQDDLDYLDENEDPGIARAFDDALAAKDAEAVRVAFNRAATDEIVRRLAGAGDNLNDYQTAKTLVVKAQRFYTAIAGDLDPDVSRKIGEDFKTALDAVGNPGVFGVGAKKPDPEAFAMAKKAIFEALGHPDA